MDYTYSILANITSQKVNIQALSTEIKNIGYVSAIYRGINIIANDSLYVSFTESITNGEKTSLDAVILNHNGNVIQLSKTKGKTFYPTTPNITNTSYTEAGSFIFKGTNSQGPFLGIDMLSYMSSGTTSYSVQILNKENNTIIAEQTFTNTSSQLISFTTINTSNIPASLGRIQVLAKVTKVSGTRTVTIQNIIFWYD